MSQLNVIKLDECWLYAGSITKTGYPIANEFINKKPVATYLHRLFYSIYNGPIPEGLVIDHLCRTRRCINPQHLEAVTVGVNTMRGMGFSGRNARKTKCKQGHPYTEENTIWRMNNNGNVGRRCRTCQRRWTRAWGAEKRRKRRLAIS